MDPKYLITALLVIPMVIVLTMVVFQNMAINNLTLFEGTAANDTMGSATIGSAFDLTGTYSCKSGSITFVGNTTHICHPNICYNVTYNFNEPCEIIDTNNKTMKGTIIATYTPYSSSGFESYKAVYNQQNSSMQLGALVPYILIALAIITVILTAFGIATLT